MPRLLPFSLVLSALFGLACSDPELPPPSDDDGAGGSGAAGGAGGAGGGASGGGGAAPAECPVLTPVDTSLYFETFGNFGVSARVDLPVEGYAKTRLALELYQGETEPLTTGTFDLSAAPDDNYGTCEHCVLLVAFDDSGQARRVFFQESGTMTLSVYDPDAAWVAAGSVESARLVEVTQHADLTWEVVPSGLCFDVPSWSFDTRIVDGGPCERVEDCPNEAAQVCDVAAGTCGPGECSLFGDPPFCDEGELCMGQVGALIDREEAGPAIGACYERCVPEGPGQQGSCADGSTCFALDATQTFGVCLKSGGPEVGEACSLPDIATGCAEGALCGGEPPSCQAICDYLSLESDCPSGTYCSSLNLCEPLSVGDVAPVGAACEPGARTLTDCGPEGDAFRGLCFRLFESEDEAVCARVCNIDAPSCGAQETCVAAFTNPHVGICHVTGTCGDGELDLLAGELCDDGNNQSGDGCNADCTAAELEPLCALAEPLPASGAVVGTTEGGPVGYGSQCDPFIATPVSTYAFTPSAPGELTLRLSSVEDLGVSVLSSCHAGAEELECRSQEGDDVVHVNFPAVPAEPALVVVRGSTPLEAGVFLLQSTFVPAVCGDGLVGGAEACDDANQVANDGCAADCSAIEWDPLCTSLATIQSGDVVTDTLETAHSFFDLTALCSFESGRDRAYSFVAPSAGTLQLSLSSQDNLSLFVRDGCGPVDESTYLSCSNFAFPGETESTSVALTAGQRVTVVVDGFTREDAGPYTLTVSFSP